MSATIIRGNALDLPLADASVDLVVTSPPYWSLRSYQDAGQHYNGQLGSEATAGDFIDNLIAATAEFMRVLKPTGSAFVNLGDKYGPNKSLMLIPERYRIACIDRLGLIARSVIVWSKPNGLPESVTDRVRRSHEDWVHLTKEPRYYSAVDEIRVPHAAKPQRRFTASGEWSPGMPGERPHTRPTKLRDEPGNDGHPLGALPGSVWTIPTQPLRVPPELGIDHFAAFPMEWPKRIIAAWSPKAICECGFLLGSSYDSGMLGVPKPVRSNRTKGQAEAVLRKSLRQQAHGSQSSQHEGLGSDVEGLHRHASPGSSDGRSKRLRDAAPADRLGEAGAGLTPIGSGASPEQHQGRQQAGKSGTAGEGRARSDIRVDAPVQDRVPSLRPGGSGAGICPRCGSSETRQSVIVDPFGGTGTTALVADVMGRRGISVDMSADYCRLAQWRTNDPKQRERAARGPKPAAKPKPPEKLAEVEFIHPDQLNLFEDGAA